MIKEGDYVVVVSGTYSWTVPGSWGRYVVAFPSPSSVLVKFEFVNTPPYITENEFFVEAKDLAPLTKLHKLLYGIEHV